MHTNLNHLYEEFSPRLKFYNLLPMYSVWTQIESSSTGFESTGLYLLHLFSSTKCPPKPWLGVAPTRGEGRDHLPKPTPTKQYHISTWNYPRPPWHNPAKSSSRTCAPRLYHLRQHRPSWPCSWKGGRDVSHFRKSRRSRICSCTAVPRRCGTCPCQRGRRSQWQWRWFRRIGVVDRWRGPLRIRGSPSLVPCSWTGARKGWGSQEARWWMGIDAPGGSEVQFRLLYETGFLLFVKIDHGIPGFQLVGFDGDIHLHIRGTILLRRTGMRRCFRFVHEHVPWPCRRN